MAEIRHVFTSPKADVADATLVRPSDWNSSHAFTGLDQVTIGGNTSGVAASISSGTVLFAGGNNITLSQNANSLTISAFNQSQQTQNIIREVSLSGNTAGALADITSGTFYLAGGNNITLSQNANSVTISAANETKTVPPIATTVKSVATANSAGTVTRFAPEDHAHEGVYAVGVSNLGNTAGDTTVQAGRMVLVGGSNISLSVATAANALQTISVNAGGTLLASQIYDGMQQAAAISNGAVCVYPWVVYEYASFSAFQGLVSASISTSSNSSHGGTLSIDFGVYTRNVSTLSLASSGQFTNAWTNTSDGSTANLSSARLCQGTFAALNLTPGNYWVGYRIQTSTVNANWITISQLVASRQININGAWGAVATATIQWLPGLGQFSVSSAALPSSIGFSEISGTILNTNRPPYLGLVNFTA